MYHNFSQWTQCRGKQGHAHRHAHVSTRAQDGHLVHIFLPCEAASPDASPHANDTVHGRGAQRVVNLELEEDPGSGILVRWKSAQASEAFLRLAANFCALRFKGL